MKPIRLKMQAFGPYAQMQTVDFEKLSEKGMFLIKGPTGSGKTTIFDAMTLALYGGSSGDDSKSKVGRNDMEQWRCNQAEPDAATVVTFVFSARGQTYEFTRKLVPKRKNLAQEYSAGRINEQGVLEPFFENPKKEDLNRKATELIGLTKEQFRQVVLLPQGQFERFLTAGSDEKAEILEKIFDAKRWGRYAELFYQETADRAAALKEEKEEVRRSLAEEGLENLEDLAARLESLTAALEENTREKEAFDAEQAQTRLNADIALAERFKDLETYERKERQLLARQQEMEKVRQELDRARKAEGLRQLMADFEQADREREKRRKDMAGKEQALPGVQAAAQEAAEQLLAQEEASPVAALQKQAGEYASKRSIYETLDTLAQNSRKTRLALQKAEKAAQQAEQALHTATQAAKEAYDRCQDQENRAKDLRDRYYAGIYGELAVALEENTPCPVCGSQIHPSPAQRMADSVSKDMVDKAEKKAQQAKELWKGLEDQREQAGTDRETAEQKKTECHRLAAAAEAAERNAGAGLIPGITTLEELNKAIEEKEQAARDYGEKLDNLRKLAQDREKARSNACLAFENAQKEYKAQQKLWDTAKAALDPGLAQHGYDSPAQVRQDLREEEQRSQMAQEITQYDCALRDTRQGILDRQRALEGMEKPDPTRFSSRQKEIRDRIGAFAKKEAELKESLQRLGRKRQLLEEKQAHYDANIAQAENDLAFGKKLRGDSGVGLQRYVLAILFQQVLGEANRMLSRVHGGRYYLYRSDEKGKGNKRGLELKVHDNRSPSQEGRGVAMLSGGEKFLVSLALSIGLSTVAQKGGVRIEALFIDEGFGTLDDSSIHDAMDVLESVRRSCGMIGIISHVQLLESNIPTHLEVVKSGTGSSIRLE